VFGPYGEVLRAPGARAFSVAGLVARLPMSMHALSIVLAVTLSGGSYALAGVAAGLATGAHAVASPVQARIADRLGQARMLVPLLIAHGVALVALMAVVARAAAGELPFGLLAAAALLTGATFPQIGALVRARWAGLDAVAGRLHTAYAWESALDEVAFVLGPIVVVVLATNVHPAAGLAAVLILTLSGGFVFASLRATEPPIRPPVTSGHRDRMPMVTLTWTVAAFVFMGAIFGTVELSTVAVAEEAGATAAAGPALAVFAAGSLIAGLASGTIHWKVSSRRRFVVGQAALAAAVLPLAFAGNLALLFAAIFVAGFAIAPTLIAGFSMVQAVVPASRVTEGLAWASTAITVGAAAGAAGAGPIIDRIGGSDTYFVAFGCGVLAALACLVGVSVDRPARSVPEPVEG
jgi:MFS family permease